MKYEDITAFYAGIKGGALAVVQNCFTFYGEDCLDTSFDKYTPLTYAAMNGHPEIIELLIVKGAKVNEMDGDRRTAIAAAACGNHADAIKMLVKHGGAVDGSAYGAIVPLVGAVQEEAYDALRTLLELKADPDTPFSTEISALESAAQRSDFRSAQMLLEAGANVNISNGRKTPLSFAINARNRELVSLLLEYGAAFDGGELSTAIGQGYADIAAILVEKAPDILKTGFDVTDIFRQPPMVSLASSTIIDDEDIMPSLDFLLSHGVEIDCRNKEGYTPLHIAARAGCATLMRGLIDAGANTKLLGPNGESVMDFIEMIPDEEDKYIKSADPETLKAVFDEVSLVTARRAATRACNGTAKPISIKPIRLKYPRQGNG